MAVTWDSDTLNRTSTLWADYPINIDIDVELNGRHEHHTQAEIEALAADILAHGQHTPVLFRKADNGRPVLVYGHRRWEAVALLNKRGKKIKLLGNYESMDEIEAFSAAIGENRFRKDVTPIDDAANIKILRDRFKKTDDDIAAIYFPEAKTDTEKKFAVHFVKQRIALIELTPEAAKIVRDGKMKITAAVRLSKLSKDAQRERIASANGKDIKAREVTSNRQKPVNVRKLVEDLTKDFKLVELDNKDNEYISVDRKRLRKIFAHLGLL